MESDALQASRVQAIVRFAQTRVACSPGAYREESETSDDALVL
jgi:hypothetical protein